jgi:acyl-CoA dehydrogenase
VNFDQPDELRDIREAVAALCSKFPGEYWRGLEPDTYPTEFVEALTEGGWLAALVPERYGGSGLGIAAAAVIMEEVFGRPPAYADSASRASLIALFCRAGSA